MKNSTKTSIKKQKLQSHTALQQFLRKAAAYKLSAGAILLWQSVYFAAQRKGKYSNVVLCSQCSQYLQAQSLAVYSNLLKTNTPYPRGRKFGMRVINLSSSRSV